MAKSKVSALSEKVKAAVAEMNTRLGEIRSEVAELRARREKIVAAPVPKAVALARLDAAIRGEAEKFENDALFVVRALTERAAPAAFEPLQIVAMEHHKTNNLNAALCALIPDQMRAYFAAQIDTEYAMGAEAAEVPMDDAPRHAALKEIDQRLAELEQAEESLRREAEDAGINIAPRGDLDPAAFLEVGSADLPDVAEIPQVKHSDESTVLWQSTSHAHYLGKVI